jgi:hypothetical protein
MMHANSEAGESPTERTKVSRFVTPAALAAALLSAVVAQPAFCDEDPGIAAGPVKITFGGFVELATIYRDRNQTADVGSNFNTAIPFPNSPNYYISEFRESARQSRLSMLAQGPQDGKGVAEGWFEMDFLGAAPTANSNESNSYNLRMRNIYATYRLKDSGFYFLAGQNWSLATLEKKGMRARSEQVPLTIDAQYVPGFNWLRNPQIRLVKEFSPMVSAGISFDSPQALIFPGPNKPLATPVYNNPGGSLYAPTNNYSIDDVPDIVAKVAFDPKFGHYELYWLGREFRDRVSQQNHTESGGGFGAGMILPFSKSFDFQVSGLEGDGIGRYGSAQLPDVTVKPDGTLAAITASQVLVGINWRPTSKWTFYSYYGKEQADAEAYSAVVNGATLGFGYGSPLYDNSGCLTEGSAVCAANTRSIEQATIGAWLKYYQGTLGNLQFGFQLSHTKREIFPGVGGDPNTDINIGMLSFRFYPYQR